ncbi:hypothetical protein [Paraburkholderia caffeinilytica]|uniref:hypothetical protein n=1 Tax=Paraburkholderia caffeinilytica TaxID=1761016 RepID=UPI0038BBB6E9
MLNIADTMNLMEAEATEVGIAACPLNAEIYARREIVWIKAGSRVGRDEVEQVLREASGFAPEVPNPYRRGD